MNQCPSCGGDCGYTKKSGCQYASKPLGRPAELKGGKRVNVYLDLQSLDAAKKLGFGNVSEGIRVSLEITSDLLLKNKLVVTQL